MGKVLKPKIEMPEQVAPQPVAAPDPVNLVDTSEAADIATPVDDTVLSAVRKRLSAAKGRVGRGQLQIPRAGGSGNAGSGGVSLPR